MQETTDIIDMIDAINSQLNFAYALTAVARSSHLNELPNEILQDYFLLLSDSIINIKQIFHKMQVNNKINSVRRPPTILFESDPIIEDIAD